MAAHTARRVARTDIVALVERRADDGIAARTVAGLAGIRLRARVRVVAARAVGFRRIAAASTRRTARAGVVTLVGRDAHDRITSRANAGLTSIGLRARVRVVAARAV